MKTRLLVLGLQLLLLIAIASIVQARYPDSFLGTAILMFGTVFVLGINAIVFLLALTKKH